MAKPAQNSLSRDYDVVNGEVYNKTAPLLLSQTAFTVRTAREVL